MTERVTVKVKPGQALAAPDGRIFRAGEMLEVSAHEAEFFERMGAAQVVAPEPAGDAPKPAKKAKGGTQSKD